MIPGATKLEQEAELRGPQAQRDHERARVAAHYENHPDIFSLVLDRRLAYATGIFAGEDEDLETAQARKYAWIRAELAIRPGERLLDVGCGWGSNLLYLAEHTAASWVTGIDPKAWVSMHRKHHAYSDGRDDPHSPRNVGIWGVLVAQLRSYERELFGLLARHPSCTARVADLEFGVGWCNRRGLWWLPYALHATIAAGLGIAAGWLLGAAWFAGLMSHPIEGWMVNAFGHAMGRRNFGTPDDSRNNYLVALLVFGEGLQNNHHHRPSSARFAYRGHEPDLGFVLCRVLARLGLLEIDEANLLAKRP